MSAGVKPRGTTAKKLSSELAALQIPAVNVGDLKFSAGRGFEALGDTDYLSVVEVDASNRVARFGLGGLFLDGDGTALVVELYHPVTLGIEDGIGEDSGSAFDGCCVSQSLGEVVSVENVVAEDEAAAFASEELFTDEEGLGKAVG